MPSSYPTRRPSVRPSIRLLFYSLLVEAVEIEHDEDAVVTGRVDDVGDELDGRHVVQLRLDRVGLHLLVGLLLKKGLGCVWVREKCQPDRSDPCLGRDKGVVDVCVGQGEEPAAPIRSMPRKRSVKISEASDGRRTWRAR